MLPTFCAFASGEWGNGNDSSLPAIYASLLDGRRVEGLRDLDVESFLAAILDSFPAAVREPNGESEWLVWTASDGKASFQAEWSPQHVVISCRGTSGDDMNRLIDIAVEQGCRLYDPQENQRFDSE
jgi:hypothetical protein